MTPALEFTGNNDAVQRNFDALAGLQPATVTSLPTTATDGSEIHYVADAANGVIWHFRYNAGSASAYKWESVGAVPLLATVETSQASAGTAFGDLATAGPTITVPLAGDYVARWGSFGQSSTTNVVLHGLQIGGTAASDAASCRGGGAAAIQSSSARSRAYTGLTASTAIASKYRTTAGTGTWEQRWLEVIPVRVG